jgi:TonB family protein
VATLGYTVTSLAKLMLLIRHSEKHQQEDGVVICVTDHHVSPFSWMHYIVLSRQDYAEHNEAVLAHERGHIRLRHSWDVLLVDTLTALQWFNPAMWMLRQDLRAIHEYEADGAVLSQGFNARQYQYLLITKAASIGGYSIANGISHSTLKNRIHMMLHKESRRSHLLKLLALVPIVGTAMALNAETVTDYQYQTPHKKQIIKKGKKAATIKADGGNEIVVIERTVTPQNTECNATLSEREPVEMPNGMEVDKTKKAFDVVEQMPQYPGGPAALMQFLAQNIRYPEEAYKAGVQGRVIVSFVVETDGSISEAKAVKSVSSELDAEALRVINSMPNWIPGMQNGEAVRVKYTIPVTFQLQGSEKPAVSHVMIGPEHKGKSKPVEVVIDGKVVDAIVMNSLNPSDIESIDVEKAKDDQPKDRIIIKMKQKKE